MKKNDILLIALLIVAAGAILFTQLSGQKKGNLCVITVNNEVYEKISLNEEKEIKIKCADGHYNILRIHDGKADMIESDCKNQVCVDAPSISKVGQTIACLPHHVIVKIISEERGKE